MGRFSDEEAQLEAFYRDEGIAAVRALWASHTPQQIARVIRHRTGYPATARLVCSLRQRLDRAAQDGAD